ncbi:MAG: transposase [Clostridia bacterium]|nr:transposase [Clostridia bacterium]
MPRVARSLMRSGYYHVIIQGLNKEYIFSKKEYIEKYKSIVHKKLEDSDVVILGYCIMNNHAHFLFYCEKVENLSKFMQRVNISYSNYYNKRKDRVGYVFRDRYFSQEIINQKQLFNCLKYIHYNPVKANICRNMNEYKYSSYNEFINDREIEIWGRFFSFI